MPTDAPLTAAGLAALEQLHAAHRSDFIGIPSKEFGRLLSTLRAQAALLERFVNLDLEHEVGCPITYDAGDKCNCGYDDLVRDAEAALLAWKDGANG